MTTFSKILLLLLCMSLWENSYSQTIRVREKKTNKEITLFVDDENDTKYQCCYNNDLKSDKKVISVYKCVKCDTLKKIKHMIFMQCQLDKKNSKKFFLFKPDTKNLSIRDTINNETFPDIDTLKSITFWRINKKEDSLINNVIDINSFFVRTSSNRISFKKSVNMEGNYTHISMSNSKFNAQTNFSSEGGNILLFNSKFSDTLEINVTEKVKVSLISSEFNKWVTIFSDDDTLNRLNASNTKFLKGLSIKGLKLIDGNFKNAEFSGVLDLRDFAFVESSNKNNTFEDSYFNNSTTIIINPQSEFTLKTWKLPLNSLQKIFFLMDWHDDYYFEDDDSENLNAGLKWDWTRESLFFDLPKNVEKDSTYTERVFEDIEKTFTKIKEYASTLKNSSNQEEYDKVIAWLDYQKTQYEILYLKDNKGVRYYWLCFLEETVKNGYRGEGRFATWCSIIILLFGFFYYLFFKKEVKNYISQEESSNESGKGFLQFIVDAVKCIWFSTIIFINPQLASKYFKFENKFLVFLIIEWIIGTFMLIVFLIFIASKYDFVSKLIGI